MIQWWEGQMKFRDFKNFNFQRTWLGRGLKRVFGFPKRSKNPCDGVGATDYSTNNEQLCYSLLNQFGISTPSTSDNGQQPEDGEDGEGEEINQSDCAETVEGEFLCNTLLNVTSTNEVKIDGDSS